MDAFETFKEQAKKTWAGFVPMESFTGTAAPKLVRFAGVAPGAKVLDVACGTGVAALTAARVGAEVTGLDLTPPLLERARQNAELMGLRATFVEGDVEALPFPDASFDVVLSQFGHMFAPRPQVAIAEMLRVLRPGGTIAFSTWPPDLYTGRFLSMVGRLAPSPPPEGTPSPVMWGDPKVVRERLGDAVRDLTFDGDRMLAPALSPQHVWAFGLQSVGPLSTIAKSLEGQPEKLAQLRREIVDLAATYFHDNVLRQDFLMTRARKA